MHVHVWKENDLLISNATGIVYSDGDNIIIIIIVRFLV